MAKINVTESFNLNHHQVFRHTQYLAVGTPVDTTWRKLTATYRYTGTNSTGAANLSIRVGSNTNKLTYYLDDLTIVPDIKAYWPQNAELTATDITATGLKLNWPAAIDSGNISGYQILKNNLVLASVSSSVYA